MYVLFIIKLQGAEDNAVKFKANILGGGGTGTFGVNVLFKGPETLDFDEIFSDLDDKIADSPYVLGANILLLSALVVGSIICRRFDARDEELVTLLHILFS